MFGVINAEIIPKGLQSLFTVLTVAPLYTFEELMTSALFTNCMFMLCYNESLYLIRHPTVCCLPIILS